MRCDSLWGEPRAFLAVAEKALARACAAVASALK